MLGPYSVFFSVVTRFLFTEKAVHLSLRLLRGDR